MSGFVIVVSKFSATRIESYDENCVTVDVLLFVQENVDMQIRSRMLLIKWLVTSGLGDVAIFRVT